MWAVYRGRLERHDNGGPEGRNATVMVATEEEIKALQVHGCFGSLVDVNWKDVARTKVEDWRPGEEEEEEEDDEEKFTATKTQEELYKIWIEDAQESDTSRGRGASRCR